MGRMTQETPRKPLVETTVTALRNLILKGELLPGERINISELARQFNHSKTPIREALNMLVSEDLVTYEQNVGYAVKEVDLQEYMQIYEIQELMETHLLRQIAKMNYLIDFDLLEKLNDELAVMIDREEWELLGEQNDKFHRAFYEHYPNPLLIESIYDIWAKVHMQRNLIFQTKIFIATAISDHKEMIEAVRCADPDRAETSARKHFSRGLESILKFFPRS